MTTLTANAHNDMLGSPVDLVKMVAGLSAPCALGVPKPIAGVAGPIADQGPTAEDDDAAAAFEDAVMSRTGQRRALDANSGCSTAPGHSGTPAGILAVGLGLAIAWARRRRSA